MMISIKKLILVFVTSLFWNVAFADSGYQCYVGIDHEQVELDSFEIDSTDWINCLQDKLVRTQVEIKAIDKPYIDNYKRQVEKLLSINPKDPVYLYLLGRLIRAQRTVYFYENEKALSDWDAYATNPVIKTLKLETNNYFEKALINNAVNYSNLTGSMLAGISYDNDVFLTTRIKAIKQGIELGKSMGQEGKGYIFRQHKRLVTVYIDANRFDDALLVLDEVQQKFPSKQNELEKARNDILTRQVRHKSEVTEQEKATQPTEPKKPDSVVTAPKQQPVVKEEKAHQKEEVLSETNNNKIFIIIIVLAVLLLVGFVAVKRKKK